MGQPLQHALLILDRHEELPSHAVDRFRLLRHLQEDQFSTGRQERLRVRQDLLGEGRPVERDEDARSRALGFHRHTPSVRRTASRAVRFGWRCSYEQNRDGSVPHDRFGNAAEEPPGHPAPTVRGHDEQIPGLRGCHQFLRGGSMPVLDCDNR